MLNLVETVTITASSGDQWLVGEYVHTQKQILLDFVGDIPQTWERLGYVFRSILLEGQWVVSESAEILPNQPNLITWSNGGEYRLLFRMVKYIRPGEIQIFSYQENTELPFAEVAYTGDYNDLLNLPDSSGPSNEYPALDRPSSPANGDVWIQTDYNRPMRGRWIWYSDKNAWLGPIQYAVIRGIITTSGTFLGAAIPYYQTGRILIESFVYSCVAYDSTWSIQPGIEAYRYSDPNVLTFIPSPESARGIDTGFNESRQYHDWFTTDDRVAVNAGYKATRLTGSGNLSIMITVGYRIHI